MTSISPQAAANAYAQSLGMAKATPQGTVPVASEGASFADFLREGVTGAIDTVKAGETMSAKAVTGQADMISVVQAVTAAELTLQSVVAIRDRMITAYQEIMRMPI